MADIAAVSFCMEYLQKAVLGAEHTTRKLAINPLFLTDNNPECLQTHGADEHSAVKPVSETRGEILALSTSDLPLSSKGQNFTQNSPGFWGFFRLKSMLSKVRSIYE